MKCIYCGTNTSYRTRQDNGGCCSNCGHQYAFEPKSDSLKVTDKLFQGAIKGVSGGSNLFFTERQLWYELNKHLYRKRRWWGDLVTIAMLSFFVFMVVSREPIILVVGAIIMLVVGITSYIRYQRGSQIPIVVLRAFRDQYLSAWTQAHGSIERLLSTPERQQLLELPTREPDLAAYSFTQALVTDQTEIAAMLVANNFHSENNCAILSIDGYPSGTTDTLLAMLRRNPQLTVYALHDASIEGCRMPKRLRNPDWFPDSMVTIFDLGLRPRQAIAQKMFIIESHIQTIPDEVRQLLTPREIAWLERGNTIELSVIRPAQLMQTIHQGLSRGRTLSADKETERLGDASDGGEIIWLFDSANGDGDGGDDGDGFG